jgi:membrane protease YdiL (CAAX protease family)
MQIEQASMFALAVKGPFLEELFFREFVQGSLISTMKLVNLAGFRMGKGVTIAEETIHTFSRIFSAATFGLAHSNQDLAQAVTAGISSYCYESWLYEKNGLFASFGLHFANNLVAFTLLKTIPKT